MLAHCEFTVHAAKSGKSAMSPPLALLDCAMSSLLLLPPTLAMSAPSAGSGSSVPPQPATPASNTDITNPTPKLLKNPLVSMAAFQCKRVATTKRPANRRSTERTRGPYPPLWGVRSPRWRLLRRMTQPTAPQKHVANAGIVGLRLPAAVYDAAWANLDYRRAATGQLTAQSRRPATCRRYRAES